MQRIRQHSGDHQIKLVVGDLQITQISLHRDARHSPVNHAAARNDELVGAHRQWWPNIAHFDQAIGGDRQSAIINCERRRAAGVTD